MNTCISKVQAFFKSTAPAEPERAERCFSQ